MVPEIGLGEVGYGLGTAHHGTSWACRCGAADADADAEHELGRVTALENGRDLLRQLRSESSPAAAMKCEETTTREILRRELFLKELLLGH